MEVGCREMVADGCHHIREEVGGGGGGESRE